MRFAVGQRVRIVRLNQLDPLPLDPDSEDPDVRRFLRFKGKTGTIRALQTGSTVGETEKDPLYTVAVVGVGSDGFWREELVRAR